MTKGAAASARRERAGIAGDGVGAAVPPPSGVPLGDEVLVMLAEGLALARGELVEGADTSLSSTWRLGSGDPRVGERHAVAIGTALVRQLFPEALLRGWAGKAARYEEILALALGAVDGAIALWNDRAAALGRAGAPGDGSVTMCVHFALDDTAIRLSAIATRFPLIGELFDAFPPFNGLLAAFDELREHNGQRATNAALQSRMQSRLTNNTFIDFAKGRRFPREDSLIQIAKALAKWRTEQGASIADEESILFVLRVARLVTFLRDRHDVVRVLPALYGACRRALVGREERELTDLAMHTRRAHAWPRGVERAVAEQVGIYLADRQAQVLAKLEAMAPKEAARFIADLERKSASRLHARQGGWSDFFTEQCGRLFQSMAELLEGSGSCDPPATSYCADHLEAGGHIFAALAPWISKSDTEREAHFRAAILCDPALVETRLMYARFLLGRGRARDACLQLGPALAVAPDDVGAIDLATHAALELNDTHTATALATRAIELGSATGHVYLAIVLRMAGERVRALETLKAGRERHPRNASILRALADLHEDIGNTRDSASARREADRLEGISVPTVVPPARESLKRAPADEVFGEIYSFAMALDALLEDHDAGPMDGRRRSSGRRRRRQPASKSRVREGSAR